MKFLSAQIVLNVTRVFISLTVVLLSSAQASADDFSEMISGIQNHFTLTDSSPYLLDGINCHGTSFQAAGVLSYPSHIDKDELNYLLDTQCTRVQGPGHAVIAVQGRRSNFSHSYYHRTATSIIEKRSLERRTPVQFLQRGPLRSAEYYSCRRLPTSCSQSVMTDFRRRIQLVGFYLASISQGRSDYRYRDKMIAYLRENITALEQTNVSADCRHLKNLVLNRGRSLSAWGDQITGMRLYINQLPRNKL